MSKYIDVNALLEVAGITVVVAVGMVLFFSLGVVALNGPREETTSLPGANGSQGSTSEQRRPLPTRVGAAAAFAACAALAILGLIVLIQK